MEHIRLESLPWKIPDVVLPAASFTQSGHSCGMARAWPLKGTVPVRPVLGNEPVQSIKGPLSSQPLPEASLWTGHWPSTGSHLPCPTLSFFIGGLCLSLLFVFRWVVCLRTRTHKKAKELPAFYSVVTLSLVFLFSVYHIRKQPVNNSLIITAFSCKIHK